MKTIRWLACVLALATIGLLLLRPGAPAAAGATLVVDDDSQGSASNCDATDAAYSTISAAVSAAAPNDTVSVCPGTYNERLSISKSLDLRGAQYGVDPTQPGARTNPADESVVDLTGLALANPNVLVEIADGTSNVSVAGFKLIGSPTFHYADEAIIRAWDNDIAVEDNIMNGYIGLLYKGPGQNLDVLRNRVTFNKNGVIVQPGTANNVDVSDNVLSLGGSPGGDEAAIYMTGVTQGTVSGNTATNIAPNGRGLYGSNLTQLTVSDNTFTGNRDAVSIFGTSTLITISDNDLSDSLRYGINIKGQDISITGNDISGCDDVGVNIDKHVLNTERVTVSNNDLSGNTNFGVKVNTALVTQTVNAEDNWWGSANGPTHAANTFNVGSQGVPVSNGADFTPWLDAAPPAGVSFAPVTTTSPVGSYASIQAGVNASNSGGTVNAAAGTYSETLRVDGTKASNISVVGADKANTFITGGVRFEGSYTGLAVENFTITGDGRQRPGLAEATIGATSSASVVTDARFSNNIFDGEGITGIGGGRFGAYLSSISGSFTLENNEVKNYRGWGTLELNEAYRTVSSYTFTGNSIHDNSGSSVLRGNPSDRTDTVTATGNVFDNNGGGDSWASLEINEADNVTVSDNSITNTQAGSWGEGEALQFWHITSLAVTDNTIEDNYQGIYFPGDAWASDLSGVEIHSNSISGNTQFGFQADAGNTGTADAEDNWWGRANGPTHASNTFNVGAQGDVVSDNVDFVPWLDAAPPAGVSFAPVTTTSPVGSYASIQAGVNASNSGGTVNAAAGTYTETLNISARSDINIVGADRDTVIVKPASTLCFDVGGYGCARRAAVRVVGSTGIDFSNMTFDFDLVKGNNIIGVFYWDSTGVIDNNVLENMTLPDASGGYYEVTSYIRAPSYNDGARAAVTFSNNVFLETGRLGIVTHDFVNATIEDNTFTKTTDDFGYAIEMGSRSTGTISGNTISGYDTAALSDGSESAGIYIENAFTAGLPHVNKPVTVSGNTITGNQYGLWIGNEYNGYAGDVDIIVTLQDNTISGNVDGGVYVVDEDRAAGSSVTLTASGNTVSNNGATGYYFNTYGDGELHATLTGETITGQATGILVEDNASGSSSSLYDLAVHGSGIGGSSYGINNTTPALVNAEDNWWGSANGPTHASNTFNVGSQGVAVSGNVDFVPWLDGPPSTGNSFAPVTTTSPTGSYASIQAGVNASNPGGTVNAKTGIFSEKVTLNKGVIVQAASSPVVDCGGPGNGFTLSANNVTISGFEIRNCSNGIQGQTSNSTISNNVIHDHLNHVGSNGVGISLWGDNDNNQISRNTVYNNDRQGIFIGHCDFAGPSGECTASTLTSSGNTISNNVIHDNGRYTQRNGPDESAYGIQLWNADNNTLSNNEIYNHTSWWFAQGVYLCESSSNTVGPGNNLHDNQANLTIWGCGGTSSGNSITGNTLSNPATNAINAWGGSSASTISGNTIAVTPASTGSAIDAGDVTANLTVSGNSVSILGSFAGFYHAINVGGGGAGTITISNNTLTGKNVPGSNDVGIRVRSSLPATAVVSMTGNTISGFVNGVRADTIAAGAALSAHYNSLAGNSTNGILNGAGALFNAEDNWWGRASGPAHASNTFNVGSQGVGVSDNVDFVPWLNAAPPAGVSFAPVTTTNPVDSYASIQAGANGSNTGSTVNAKAGTFDEQVVIAKSLTLQGAGTTTVVKPSSATKLATVLSGHWWGLTRQIAGIVVANVPGGGSVTMKSLEVDGASVTTQPTGADFVAGTFYRETGGSIETVTMMNMTVGATGTAVRGYGAYLSAVANTVSVEIKGSTFTNYDKNGIDAHGNKLSVNAHDNNLTGRGPLPSGDEVQNGIVVMDGAVGAVNSNTVNNHVYTPETSWSAAILFQDSGGSAWNNTLTNNQIGVIFQDGNGSASGNTVSGGKLGLYAQGTKPGTWTASFTGNTVGGSDTSGIGGATYHSGASLAVGIANNSLTGGTGDGVAIGDVPAANPAGSVSATVTGNVISGWLRGVDLLSSAAASTSINFNTISGNTQFGVRNLVAFTVNAENNSWGACDGPGPVGPGSGDAVSTLVDYDPWLHGGCDYDGDKLGDDQESLIGTDWQNPDTDGDGCDDGREYVAMPGFKPQAPYWYDVYDVPVPANPDMTPNGPRNRVVDIGDVLAVLLYAFADDGGSPNANGLDYDSVKGSCDVGGDTVPDEEGMCYDRTASAMPNPPWEAGPPNGVIDIADVLVALGQAFAVDCSGGP